MSTTALTLDIASLPATDLSEPALMRELNLQQRPHWILRRLMGMLEQKRQAKRLGWSRAWNKQGLNVFRTHVQDFQADRDYFAPLGSALEHLLPAETAGYQNFVTDLLSDRGLLTFTFYHNHEGPDGQFEGLTLSFGRKVVDDPGKRDRLDLVLEDRRRDGRVDGRIDRIRLYVCPWSEYKQAGGHLALVVNDPVVDSSVHSAAQELYENCIRHYHAWKGDESRQWSHWSSRFIEYFGPRTFIPIGTSFS